MSWELIAQTMPSAQSLPYSEDFSGFTGSGTNYPAGWQAWVVATSSPSSTGRTNAPTGDASNRGAGNATNTSSGFYDYSGKIGFLSTSNPDVALCLAINTTNKSNIKITFDAMTIRNLYDGVSASSGYQNGLVLQYRIGTTGLFTPLTYAPAEYLTGSTVQNTATTVGLNPATGLNAFLPALCENLAVVQVRWIYRNVPGGTSGNRPSMALDNIAIDAVPVAFIANWPKAENPTASGFTVKSKTNTPGTTYFVVLPSGAAAPTPVQIKSGLNAGGVTVADNQKGSITNTSGSTEYLLAVSGLSSNTTYDVYFVAQGNSELSLQTTSQKATVTTSNTATAPTVIEPTVSTITNNSAVLGGNITSDGGSTITERGTLWSLTSGVSIADNMLAEGNLATGVFSHTRTSLPSKSHIYYKVYAKNAINTTLSSESSFYTIADEPTSAVGSFTAMPTSGSSTSLDLSWTPATGADGYIIIIRSGATGPGTVPSDLTLYSVGAGIGTGIVAAFINSGSTTSSTLANLASNQLYTIRIYPFGFDGSNAETINYAGTLYVSTQATTTIGTALNLQKSGVKLSVSNNNITISGAKNQILNVYSTSGQLIKYKLIISDNETTQLKNGFYILNIGSERFKILITN